MLGGFEDVVTEKTGALVDFFKFTQNARENI